MLDVATSNSNNDQFSSNSEANDEERSKLNVNTHITPASLNKIIKNIEDFCDMYSESKHTKIIKYKAMTPIVQKLEEIYVNF